MSTHDYVTYLTTPEWWSLRRLAMRRAQFQCERQAPGEARHEGALELHHKHYRTLGCETLDDVEVLCAACHRAELVPRNRRKRQLEQYGQRRLFDRWNDDVAVDDHLDDAA